MRCKRYFIQNQKFHRPEPKENQFVIPHLETYSVGDNPVKDSVMQ